MAQLQNIIRTAQEKRSFQSLLKAAEILGLIGKYSNTGPFTVFAPVESAFEMIPEEVIEEAFADIPYLMGIIDYHIVEGKYMMKDLQNIGSLRTIGGKELRIKHNGGIMVDTASITEPDIECSNGVIHAISEILIP
ncbi:MAG: fasciclin domain-containing protein [Methanomethylovorans sp.]|uniref:fasciclin domain-containing protein n=1 Tax=Methanomethylovorans sp. TaxID=2758717 RepID=UPI000AC6B0FA|nr:fasciclin domain-containing protein [Methanomethylovorans sp.]